MSATCRDIIKKHLEGNGFEGLCSTNAPCGCVIDDLAPCDEGFSDCVPGYKIVNPERPIEFYVATYRQEFDPEVLDDF